MLIEICEDIIAEVEKGKEDAISTLEKIGLAYKYGKHIVFLKVKLYDRIINSNCVSAYIKNLFRQIKSKNLDIGSIKKSVTFYAQVTFNESTQRQDNCIIINPRNNDSFEFYEETHFLVENLLDEEFYKHCLDYYKRKNNKIKIGYSYYPLLGGGSTITKVYQLEIKLKQHFCLAIVDSDKKCPEGSKGDTAKSLLVADKKKPFNCKCYVMEKVMEIENLLPTSVVEQSTNKKIPLPKEALSFFDYKKGLCIDDKLLNKELLQHWKEKLNGTEYYEGLTEIEGETTKTDFEIEKFKEKYKNQKLIEGFGKNVLNHCLENYKDDLENIRDNNLTSEQKYEWTEIGKLFFEWTCAPLSPKRT